MATMTTSNTSSYYSIWPFTSNKLLWTVAFSAQFVLGVIGNLLIVWMVYKDNRLKTTTNYLMASMAFSDLLLSFSKSLYKAIAINHDFVWPFEGDFGNAICKLKWFVDNMFLSVSTFCCVAIAIDRYYAVAHPLRRIFQSKMKFIIPGIWILTGLCNSPYFYVYRTVAYYGITWCSARRNERCAVIYEYSILSMTVFFPALVITITYTLIVIKLYKHKTPGVTTDLTRRRREQQNKRVLQMAMVIVLLLYFSIACGFVHFYVNSTTDFALAWKFVEDMSAVYNVFIAVIFNDIYRENVKVIMKRFCCFCRFNRSVGNNTREASVPRPAVIHEMAFVNTHSNT